MKFLLWAAAFVVLSIAVQDTYGTDCVRAFISHDDYNYSSNHRFYRSQINHAHPVHVQPFALGYTHGSGSSVSVEQFLKLKNQLLELKIEQMKLQMKLHGGGDLKTVDEPEHVTVMRKYCASCHNETKTRGDVKLFDNGRYVEPDADLKVDIAKQVSLGLMPKSGKLEDADFIKLMKGL